MTRQEAATESSAFLRSLAAGKHGGLFEGFLRLAEGPGRMFHRLPGVLVSRLVIFLAVMHRGRAMRVRGLLVELSGSLMRIVCHEILRSAHLTVALCDARVHDAPSPAEFGAASYEFGPTQHRLLDGTPPGGVR